MIAIDCVDGNVRGTVELLDIMVDGTLVVGNDGVVCPVVCICRFVAVQVRAIT